MINFDEYKGIYDILKRIRVNIIFMKILRIYMISTLKYFVVSFDFGYI